MRSPRIRHFIIGLVFTLLGFVGKSIYRPYSYANDLSDAGFANSAPSLFYVVGFSLLLAIQPQLNVVFLIILVSSCSIVYEVYQAMGSLPLDVQDIIFSLIGGTIAFLLHSLLCLKHAA